MFRYTHIWDIDEYRWFIDHSDMILTVPACAEFFGATRNHKTPLLVMPEDVLIRGTNKIVQCPVCAYLNIQIRQGKIQDPDIWEDLAEISI